MESQSTVTVLQQNANRLERVGSVTGLGKGERIYAVRFMGDKGYVVTFRQIDPLYTLDLSDPTAPKVVGELKIPGYSAYLHPVGENRLLGIGREGASVQASLFDVSNMAAPQRLAQLELRPGRDAGRDRAARVPVLGEGEPGRDAARRPTARRELVQRRRRHADRARTHWRTPAGSSTTAPRAAPTSRSSARS